MIQDESLFRLSCRLTAGCELRESEKFYINQLPIPGGYYLFSMTRSACPKFEPRIIGDD